MDATILLKRKQTKFVLGDIALLFIGLAIVAKVHIGLGVVVVLGGIGGLSYAYIMNFLNPELGLLNLKEDMTKTTGVDPMNLNADIKNTTGFDLGI